jgi:hypothetical protein
MIAVSAGCRRISNSTVEEGLRREGCQPSNTQNPSHPEYFADSQLS